MMKMESAMRQIVALLALVFLTFSTPASAQDGPRLSLAAVQASKEFKSYLDKAAADKAQLDLSAPPGSTLFATIFDTKAVDALPAPTSGDLPWLSEWLGVAASSYVGIINVGTDPKGEPLQKAVQDNVVRYEDKLTMAMDFLLRLMPRMAIAAEAFMQALPEKERNLPARQQGLAQVRSGYMQTVSGALTFISGGPKVDNSRVLAKALRDTVDVWSKRANPEERTQFLSLLAQARTSAKDAAVDDQLIAVSTAIAAIK
jgi:hypothetical protein